MKKFNEFINEVERLRIRPKNSDKVIQTDASVRNKVFKYVNNKSEITEQRLLNFLNRLYETEGRNVENGSKWLQANKKYFNIKESENGNIYSLSKEGLNIIKEMNRLQGRGYKYAQSDCIITNNGNPKSYTSRGKVRDAVLNFLDKNKKVTKEDFNEFVNRTNESEEGVKINKNWIKKNSHLVETIEKDGNTFYRLTLEGQKVLKASRKIDNVRKYL